MTHVPRERWAAWMFVPQREDLAAWATSVTLVGGALHGALHLLHRPFLSAGG